MRQLLDTESQRLIQILEILLLKQKHITIGELAVQIDASERTVSADIARLRGRWGNELEIHVSQKYGVSAENRSTALLGHICKTLFHESTALKWIECLLFDPYHSPSYYEEKIFTSASTLNRLFVKINARLNLIGIYLLKSKQGYYLYADNDQDLRKFMTRFLFEMHNDGFSTLTPAPNLGLYADIILNGIGVLHNINDDIALGYNSLFYFLSLVRESQGFHCPSDRPARHELTDAHLAAIQSMFPGIKEDNIRPIHAFIVSSLDTVAIDNSEEVTAASHRFINDTFSALSISAEEKYALLVFAIQTLYQTFAHRPQQTEPLYDRVVYFSLSFQQSNPRHYAIITEHAIAFATALGLEPKSSLKFAQNVVFWLCLLCPEIKQAVFKKNVLVISDFGHQHAQFIASFLTQSFNRPDQTYIETHITSTASLTPELLRSFDLLVTTTLSLPVRHDKTFLINDYPSAESLMAIYQALLE